MHFRGIALLIFVSLLASSLSAQVLNRLNFSAGGGFSSPVESAGQNLNTGWNIDFRGGVNATPHLLADLDVNYSSMGLNSAALNYFGEPGGSVSVWSIAFQPMLRLLPRHSSVNFYATAGFGISYRNLSLTRPALVTSFFCDPFFGCYPVTYTANQVVASFSTWKPGWNVGPGVEFRLGQSHARIFAEARYSRMFTTHGDDLTYVPVTFGIRW